MKPTPATKREPKDPKGKYEKPISLWPLSPDEAIGALLKVPPPREDAKSARSEKQAQGATAVLKPEVGE